ncbi:MAG: polyprenyl synthetase family protein [Bacteroidales bacterium]|nr:polyprenyl synthetase family protein [Bacteroidales bacterium]
MYTLDDIKRPVSKELAEFENYFRDVMKSDIPLLNFLIKYVLKRKGKQMRPLLVFLSAKLFGEPNKSTFTAAAMIEILHTATLIHDDVVDDSHQRRGFFSINAIWKSKISVLLGDYLLAKGLLLAVNNHEYDLLHLVSNAVKEMSEGELLQIKYSRKLIITEDEYFDIIKKKTATLISCCSSSGVISIGMADDTVQKMKRFGEFLGIAFQIKDDLLDFQNNKLTGKPALNDIKEKKLTLPIIHSLSTANHNDRQKLLRLLNNSSMNHHRYTEIIDFINREGGIEYANNKMLEYSSLALSELDSLPKGEIKNSLTDFVHYTNSRKL